MSAVMKKAEHGNVEKATVPQILAPASIAVVGASEDQSKFGGRLFRMLLKHRFAG